MVIDSTVLFMNKYYKSPTEFEGNTTEKRFKNPHKTHLTALQEIWEGRLGKIKLDPPLKLEIGSFASLRALRPRGRSSHRDFCTAEKDGFSFSYSSDKIDEVKA